MKMKKTDTRILVEAALMVAVSSVLCVFPKFKFLPNGGSITLCSMLPMILLSYRRGFTWGFAGSLVFALVQILTGFSSSGLGGMAVVAEFLFDYLLAFTVLGIGGLFKDKLGNRRRELVLGSLIALLSRYFFHVVSGCLVWGEYAEWFFENTGEAGAAILERFTGNALIFLYSLIYNGSFMIPEIILTCIGAAFLAPYSMFGIETSDI